MNFHYYRLSSLLNLPRDHYKDKGYNKTAMKNQPGIKKYLEDYCPTNYYKQKDDFHTLDNRYPLLRYNYCLIYCSNYNNRLVKVYQIWDNSNDIPSNLCYNF